MQHIKINGKKVKLSCSVATLVLYEQEFDGSDLIKDAWGRVNVAGADEGIIDFTSINWSKMPKCIWALAKTADKTFPSFNAWISTDPKFSMNDAVTVVTEAMQEGLFPNEDAEKQE